MSSSSSTSGLGTSEIIGIVIGGVLALVTIIGIAMSCYAMCCKKNKSPQVSPYTQPNYQQQNPYGQPVNTGYYQQPAYAPQEPYYGAPPKHLQEPYYGVPPNNPQQSYYGPRSSTVQQQAYHAQRPNY